MNTGSNSSRSWPQTASSTNANMHILKECIDGWINTDLLSSINPMGKCTRQTCKIFLFCRASRLMGPWFTTVVIFLRVYYKPGAMNTHWFTSLDLLLSFWMFLGIVSRIVSVRSRTIFISPNLLLVFTREIVYRWHTHGSAAKLTLVTIPLTWSRAHSEPEIALLDLSSVDSDWPPFRSLWNHATPPPVHHSLSCPAVILKTRCDWSDS